MEKLLTYVMLVKIIFKNYIFNSFLKTIMYFIKLIIIFLFVKIKNRTRLNQIISYQRKIYNISNYSVDKI